MYGTFLTQMHWEISLMVRWIILRRFEEFGRSKICLMIAMVPPLPCHSFFSGQPRAAYWPAIIIRRKMGDDISHDTLPISASFLGVVLCFFFAGDSVPQSTAFWTAEPLLGWRLYFLRCPICFARERFPVLKKMWQDLNFEMACVVYLYVFE